MITVFYHLGQIGVEWKDIFLSDMQRLSEIIDRVDTLNIHINLASYDPLPEFSHFIPPEKIGHIYGNQDPYTENETLAATVFNAQKDIGGVTFYCHSKGVTNSSTKDWSNFLWDKCLEIDTCLDYLKNYSTCGPIFTRFTCFSTDEHVTNSEFCYFPHYAGNFFWAKNDYLAGLNITFFDNWDMRIWTNQKEDLPEEEEGKGFYKRLIGEQFLFNSFYPQKSQNLSYKCLGRPQAVDLYHNSLWNTWTSRPKIGLIAMFRNEASVIKRMLDSTLGHISYYVLQDNGSTDGTDVIAETFLKENNLKGFVYKIDEWRGYGWNRDHVLQKFKSSNHLCDWITKMDCDETLVVEDDFDWEILRDLSVPAWDIPCLNGTMVYWRTWLWNSHLNWRFHDDVAHETTYLASLAPEEPDYEANYDTVKLPYSFRHEPFFDGESYSNTKKYAIDALNLEKKMLEEDSFLSNHYHFWYIAKSYYDNAVTTTGIPEFLRIEYTRRAIQLWKNYLEVGREQGWNWIELNMWAAIFIGNMYTWLEEYDEAEKYYLLGKSFVPDRTEAVVALIDMYISLGDRRAAVTCFNENIQYFENFPDDRYEVFLDKQFYMCEGGGQVPRKYQQTLLDTEEALPLNNASTNLIIIDNFYKYPDKVRQKALGLEYVENLENYKGLRSSQTFIPKGLKTKFEKILNVRLDRDLEEQSPSGCFQITTEKDPQVFHCDNQKWGAVVFLTPNAPTSSGTRLHSSVFTTATTNASPEISKAFSQGFFNESLFPTIAECHNVYNRCVIFNGHHIHSAGPYFGNSKETGRLVQLFFFE